MSHQQKVINNFLDKLVCPEVHLLRRSWSAFQVCGVTGFTFAAMLAMILVTQRGLSPWVMTGIVLVAVLIFLGLAMIAKIISDEERIVIYTHQITILIVVSVLLWVLGQPMLPYLDVTMLGLGLLNVCGRMGCLMVGCCHGKPYHWGVCYREEHAAAGFTPCLVGVRLFPIQIVESFWCLSIVLVGGAFIISGRTPGEALTWYVIMYSGGRFFFEFMRGDHDHSYFLGFSRPQWTSLFLVMAVVSAELFGVLTFHLWHVGAVAILLVTMIVVILKRPFQRIAVYRLLHPRHIKEVAEAVGVVSNLATYRTAILMHDFVPADIYVSCTSLGIQISASKIKSESGCIYHYALSSQNEMMNEETATTLSRLILQLKHPSGLNQVIKGKRDVFHLLVYS